MSLDALPADPALPQLGLAGDGDRMRELLRRHLRPLRGNDSDIEACRVSRIHYHRGERCALRYTLRLLEPHTGRERSQWVTGLIHAGDRAARLWERLGSSDPGRAAPKAFRTFEPLSFIPDLQMLVQVFPFDRRLPALPRLMLAPPPDLEPLFREELGPGDRRLTAYRVRPVQYRIGRAVVLRYEMEAAGETRRLYAKVYRSEEQAERASRVLSLLGHEAGSLAVLKPVSYARELKTLVQREAPGSSLQQLLLRDGAEPALRQAARALSRFRDGPSAGLPHHGLADEVAVLRTASRVLGWACPQRARQVDAIVDTIATRLEEVSPQPTHGELKTAHVFLAGDTAFVVDLDSCGASDPLLDPARILADLRGLPLRLAGHDDRRSQQAAHAFADEYLRAAPPGSSVRLAPHYAGALLKEAVDFFRHLEPGWAERVPLLIEQAERALSRREW